MPRVALVGYTNVGKSTLMRVLSKEDVFAEDKLFATVDSTVRKVVINTIPFLLTDTVGFIRKLPHTLVECFKSTLDEVREADILLHVVDISHGSFEEQIDIVKSTLGEIKATDKKVILVFNKVDAFDDLGEETKEDKLEQLKNTYMSKDENVIFVSAKNKTNIDELKDLVFQHVKDKHMQIYPNYTFYDESQWYE